MRSKTELMSTIKDLKNNKQNSVWVTPDIAVIFLAAGLACSLTGWPGIILGIGAFGMAGVIWWTGRGKEKS